MMERSEMIRIIRGFIKNRRIAYNRAGTVCRAKLTALSHLEFYMPDFSWPEDRIKRFVRNNSDRIETIMPHRDKYFEYRVRILNIIKFCQF